MDKQRAQELLPMIEYFAEHGVIEYWWSEANKWIEIEGSNWDEGKKY